MSWIVEVIEDASREVRSTGTPRWIFSRSYVTAQLLIGGLLDTCVARPASRRSPRHMCRSNRPQNKSPQLIARYVRGNDVADHAPQTHASVKPLCVGRGGQQIRAKEFWFAARSASWCGLQLQTKCTCANPIHPSPKFQAGTLFGLFRQHANYTCKGNK